jgi:hypothetical protein
MLEVIYDVNTGGVYDGEKSQAKNNLKLFYVYECVWSTLNLLFAADVEDNRSFHELAGNDEEGGRRAETARVLGNILHGTEKVKSSEIFLYPLLPFRKQSMALGHQNGSIKLLYRY